MKTILLTGDSRGLGYEVAKSLIEKNYRVLGVSRKESQYTDFLSKQYPNHYHHLNYDLSNTEQLKDFYFNKIKCFAPFYGFVNNAAIAYDDIITNLNIEKLNKMYQVNVFSPMLLTKYLIRETFLHKNEINLVHISSISAHTGFKGLSFYASTKGAIESFSKNTAREWGPRKVYSNVVCPGFMETDMSSGLSDIQKNKIYRRNSTRKPTKTADVSKMVLFLIENNTGEITGQVIHVDNGAL